VAWVKPSGSNDLGLGKEAEAFFSVSSAVTEQGVLPTTEAKVRYRNWNWYVDSNHSHLNLVLELTSRSTIVSENCSSISKLSGVD
jgi:hypothetical protein